MFKSQLISILKNSATLIIGVGAHHYGSKILENKIDNPEPLKQSSTDEKIEALSSKIQEFLDKTNKPEDGIWVPKDQCSKAKDNLEKIILKSEEAKKANSAGTSNMDTELSNAEKGFKELKDLINSWSSGKGGGNTFLPDFTIDNLYAYLDTLTLLEESAFLHIAMFIFILCCIVNIFLALFGNEMVQYFKLEERLPKLSILFKYRAKYQRYYLAWNILSIILVCILAICLNLLVLY